MADSNQARNRRFRRAAARQEEKKTGHLDQSNIKVPLAHPNRSAPKAKTLVEIIEEREDELMERRKALEKERKRDKDGDWEFNDEPLGLTGEAVVYTFSLGMIHLTLDILVFNQYRQEIVWKEVFTRTATFVPVLFLTIYMAHTRIASRFKELKQLVFLVSSVAAGCYMVYSGNKHSYFAVMKRAPPLGTLWVWSVVEMQAFYALTSVIAVLTYLWWNDFSAF